MELRKKIDNRKKKCLAKRRKVPVNIGLDLIQIITQKEAISKKKNSKLICPRKKAITLHIFPTTRNSNSKVIKLVRIYSRTTTSMRKRNQFRELRKKSARIVFIKENTTSNISTMYRY